MHLLMPMGGGGTRFGNKGFNCPKPLIELQGKPFFYWAARSVTNHMEVDDITFVVLKDHVERFSIDKKIIEYYPDANIHVIPQVLNGAVLTCLEGIKDIKDNLPVLFNDCDHAFISEELYSSSSSSICSDADGALLTFKSSSPAYSYVMFDESGSVAGTVEKKVVSTQAICGAYYFSGKDIFEKYALAYLNECSYSEFFMSGVYNQMIKDNKKIITFKVDEHITFGTPEEFDEALNDKRLKELI